jgi:hypothetical protein
MSLGASAQAAPPKLPRQCTATAKVLCISKNDRKLRFVVNGRVRLTLDARFGDARGSGFATHEGFFTVFRKERMSWSKPYRVYMPYSMYFSGGQAVHYSSAFAREGYNGSSHGCVNIRDMKLLAWLYSRAPIGTPVYIY